MEDILLRSFHRQPNRQTSALHLLTMVWFCGLPFNRNLQSLCRIPGLVSVLHLNLRWCQKTTRIGTIHNFYQWKVPSESTWVEPSGNTAWVVNWYCKSDRDKNRIQTSEGDSIPPNPSPVEIMSWLDYSLINAMWEYFCNLLQYDLIVCVLAVVTQAVKRTNSFINNLSLCFLHR